MPTEANKPQEGCCRWDEAKPPGVPQRVTATISGGHPPPGSNAFSGRETLSLYVTLLQDGSAVGRGRHGTHPAMSPSCGTSVCRAPCRERGASRALGMLAVLGEAKLCHRAFLCPAGLRPPSLCCRVPEVMAPRSRRRAARGPPRTPRPRRAQRRTPRRPPGAGLTCASASACRGLSSPTRPLMVPAPRPRRRLLRAAGMELGEAAPPGAGLGLRPAGVASRTRPGVRLGRGGRWGRGWGWTLG